MRISGSDLRETFFTNSALVGFFTGMDSDMTIQRIQGFETLKTIWTVELVAVICVLIFEVQFQMPFLAEFFTAFATSEFDFFMHDSDVSY